MQMIACECSSIPRRRRATFTTLALFASIAAASNVRADEPTLVRVTLARSVSAIPLWGIGPFAKKAGFRVEYIPAGTNTEMQRNIQSGVEIGTLGYQSLAIMADQNVTNVKVVAGDVPTMVNVAREGLVFGFTKTSTKVPDFVDMSYLSAATGKPADQLATIN